MHGSLNQMSDVTGSRQPGVSESESELPHDALSALEALEKVESMPIHEHVAVFETIHSTLRASLNRPANG